MEADSWRSRQISNVIQLLRTDLIDPRPQNHDGPAMRRAVRISAPELAGRVFELPDKHRTVTVANVGPQAAQVLDTLRSMGRSAILNQAFEYGVEPEHWRLWDPAPQVELESQDWGESVLDLGCGTGRDAVYLAAQGKRVVAIDRLPDAIDRARQLQLRYAPHTRFPITWIVRDIRSGIADLGQFNVVLSVRLNLGSLRDIVEPLVANGAVWVNIPVPNNDLQEQAI